jgi:hypothetical protein
VSQLPPESSGVEDHDKLTLALFDGDQGALDLEEREVLVALLRSQVLSAARRPREFEALLRHREIITSRLHELFLDLVLDAERGVAYKVQIRAEGSGHFPALLRDTAYSREETLLLVHLRHARLVGRAAGEEHVFIDQQECLDAIERFRPEHATDVAGDLARARRAVKEMQAAGVLAATATPERFAITAVIEVILPVTRLQELIEALGSPNAAAQRLPSDDSLELSEEDDD